jgi:predicted DCC family thiol-disulfide oxidoreductase YuxK
VSGAAEDWLFYDGDCGLCHGAVRFVLARGPRSLAFRFAPLQGEAFRREIPAEVRAGLPDSLVVKAADGRVLVRTAGVVRVLHGLGGPWSLLGSLLWLVPRPLRDLGYVLVAKVRRRLFPLEEGACPWRTPQQRARFEA